MGTNEITRDASRRFQSHRCSDEGADRTNFDNPIRESMEDTSNPLSTRDSTARRQKEKLIILSGIELHSALDDDCAVCSP